MHNKSSFWLPSIVSGLALASSFLLLGGCEKVKPSPQPAVDCTQANPTESHYFTLENQVDDKYFVSDTIFPGTVRLSASTVYTAVRWQIGTDPRVFTKPTFNFDFPTAVGTIQVRLIGTRPLNACIPRDTGVDTLSQQLTVLLKDPAHLNSAIEGKFTGAVTGAPADVFTIRIVNEPDPIAPASTRLNLYNLNKGCPGLDMNIIGGYKAITFSQSRGDAACHGVYGSAALDPKDRQKIRVLYQEQVTPGQPQTVAREFIGSRVP